MAEKFQETIYKKLDGTFVFRAIKSVGAGNAVDFSDVHAKSARHYEGEGFPKVKPNETTCDLPVWDMFHNIADHN